MTSMIKRVLTTFITLPVLFCLIFFLPHYGYLALSILAVLTTIAAASEVHGLFAKAEVHLPKAVIFLVGLMPVAQWLVNVRAMPLPLVDIALIALALIFFSAEIIAGKKDSFARSLLRIAAMAFIIIYPGLLITYIQRLTAMVDATTILLLFFILIFGNDVFAFVFGMWLGKNNRGVVAVSPNKSIAGFIGGTLSAMVLGLLYTMFVGNLGSYISIPASLILSFATATAANIGDLIESAFKRSVDVKDSGHLIPGRGGLLDSIDSMLVGAPVFYLILTLL
ncbi:MAG: phosphatidate cytidylyltransferase [Sphaerochaeta sp.]|jgi:phosphatidate cytidylyltransferase